MIILQHAVRVYTAKGCWPRRRPIRLQRKARQRVQPRMHSLRSLRVPPLLSEGGYNKP